MSTLPPVSSGYSRSRTILVPPYPAAEDVAVATLLRRPHAVSQIRAGAEFVARHRVEGRRRRRSSHLWGGNGSLARPQGYGCKRVQASEGARTVTAQFCPGCSARCSNDSGQHSVCTGPAYKRAVAGSIPAAPTEGPDQAVAHRRPEPEGLRGGHHPLRRADTDTDDPQDARDRAGDAHQPGSRPRRAAEPRRRFDSLRPRQAGEHGRSTSNSGRITKSA
jgi:hypothetical protein